MNNRMIKVVKRNKQDVAEKTQAVSTPLKNSEDEIQQKAVSTLNNWITERRESSRREKEIFAVKLSEWKAVSNL